MAKKMSIYIYNVCDHQECYREVGSQAISYTTGVPAMIGQHLSWIRYGKARCIQCGRV